MKWLTVLKRIALVVVPLLWLAGMYLLLALVVMSDFELDFSLEARLRHALGVPAVKEPSLVEPMLRMLLGAAVCGIAAIIVQWVSECNRELLSARTKRVLLAVQMTGSLVIIALLLAIDFCMRREGSDGTPAYVLCAPCILGIAAVGVRALRAGRKGMSLG